MKSVILLLLIAIPSSAFAQSFPWDDWVKEHKIAVEAAEKARKAAIYFEHKQIADNALRRLEKKWEEQGPSRDLIEDAHIAWFEMVSAADVCSSVEIYDNCNKLWHTVEHLRLLENELRQL